VADQEGALAEHPVADDVAEVLEHDPPDEPDVQGGQQHEVGGPQVAAGEHAEDERQTHEERRQHERGDHSASRDAERRE